MDGAMHLFRKGVLRRTPSVHLLQKEGYCEDLGARCLTSVADHHSGETRGRYLCLDVTDWSERPAHPFLIPVGWRLSVITGFSSSIN
jgi:hypothetical protein